MKFGVARKIEKVAIDASIQRVFVADSRQGCTKMSARMTLPLVTEWKMSLEVFGYARSRAINLPN